jgi:hypothetical protein
MSGGCTRDARGATDIGDAGPRDEPCPTLTHHDYFHGHRLTSTHNQFAPLPPHRRVGRRRGRRARPTRGAVPRARAV